jgi:hypothetical protein
MRARGPLPGRGRRRIRASPATSASPRCSSRPGPSPIRKRPPTPVSPSSPSSWRPPASDGEAMRHRTSPSSRQPHGGRPHGYDHRREPCRRASPDAQAIRPATKSVDRRGVAVLGLGEPPRGGRRPEQRTPPERARHAPRPLRRSCRRPPARRVAQTELVTQVHDDEPRRRLLQVANQASMRCTTQLDRSRLNSVARRSTTAATILTVSRAGPLRARMRAADRRRARGSRPG